MPDNRSLEALQIQPVGEGLIDLICPPEHIHAFIDFCEAFRLILLEVPLC